MHNLRFKTKNSIALYHCISRTVNGEKLLDDASKETLRKHLHQAAEFSGVEIITYALMDNHFHVLVKVPEQGVLCDAELVRRYKVLHPQPSKWVTMQIEVLAALLKENGPEGQKLRKRLLARMGDVSEFMKTFKQRFSIWFNANHDRFGPVWAERFTSTIIEGGQHFGLQMVAAYIDLNPVRAGIVRDPKDYRWCGYAEAESRRGRMLRGLRAAVSSSDLMDDAEVLATYRVGLFGKGAAAKRGDSKAARISAEALGKVERVGGRLSDSERLRLRVSWFTRGGVIGSKAFVDEHLVAYRTKMRRRTRLAACSLGSDSSDALAGLYSMRTKH
jgi:REP element-mobilizing transposase RayT